MNTTFKYGRDEINCDLPETTGFLYTNDPEFKINKEKFTSTFTALLKSENRNYSDVGIVLGDKTRLCGYDLYLPWVIQILEKQGAKKENIKIYIAYGTHPKQTREECISSYGKIYDQLHFIHHDSSEEKAMASLGFTSRGTEIKLRKDILQSSLIITYGAISHHYFAGYGGGRKLLFPGLAYKPAIYQNHNLFLNKTTKTLEKGCQPGNLNGNPIASDLKEIDDVLPAKISIHGLLNSEGKVCDFMFGKSYDDFLRACEVHDDYFRSGAGQVFDIVIASSGGFPKDINFIQSHKSMHNAAAFVKDGGTLILLAECPDGIGNDKFLPLFEDGDWNSVFNKLAEKYEGNGGTALATMAKTSRINIKMLTALDKATCDLLNVGKVNLKDLKNELKTVKGDIAAIFNASMLVK
jgi:nickel-dependent lactate racemase